MINDIIPPINDVNPVGYYVYEHYRLTDGAVFYVGKGSGGRGWWRWARNKFWTNTARKHGVGIRILKDGMSEQCSYTLERIIIRIYKSQNIKLCNKSQGGVGSIGVDFSEEDLENRRKKRNIRMIICSGGKKFNTLKEASTWLLSQGVNKADCSSISSCINGNTGSAYGYSWWRDGDKEKEFIHKNKRKSLAKSIRIYCSNGMSFENGIVATNWVRENINKKADRGTIYKCVNGKTASAYGLFWYR